MLAVTSCNSSGPPLKVDRVAFLRVDNLTGDPSLDWISDVLPVIAANQLTGTGNLLPLRASGSVEATGAGANHMVHGYVDRRGGKLHFEFSIEDTATHKMLSVSFDGDPLAAANVIAKAVHPGAHAFGSTKLDAIEAWGRRDYAKAVQLDPDFGLAWRDFIQAQQPEAARQVAQQALMHPTMHSPADWAQVRMLAAQLLNDPNLAIQAGDELSKLQSNDAQLIQSLAEQESAARRFDRSVKFYRQLLELEPEALEHYNLLGYAQFFSGDLAGARKSFQEYGKAPGQQSNALDSEGEVLFMAGQFKEAERYFLDAHRSNPSLLGGSDLLKAASARWLSGDLPGADRQFEDYLRFRAQNGDATGVWRRSVWDYSTGRKDEAVARLKSATGPVTQVAQSQLAVWDNAGRMQQDPAMLERTYRATPAVADGWIRTFYAFSLLKSGQREEAAKLVDPWPLPETGDPLLQSLLYPTYLDLRKQLGK